MNYIHKIEDICIIENKNIEILIKKYTILTEKIFIFFRQQC